MKRYVGMHRITPSEDGNPQYAVVSFLSADEVRDFLVEDIRKSAHGGNKPDLSGPPEDFTHVGTEGYEWHMAEWIIRSQDW